MACQVSVQGLEHHPLARGDGSQRRELGLGEGAGVGVGEQARLVAHDPGDLRQVCDRRGEARGRQPASRRRVTVLRSLPEGEEGLVAARHRAAAREGEDRVALEVGR